MIKTDNKQQNVQRLVPSVSIKSIVQGVFISYIFLTLTFLVLAVVYTYTAMPDKYLAPATDTLSAASIFIAGFVSAAKAKTHGWLHGLSAGVVYAIIRIITGFAIFGKYVPSEGILFAILTVGLIAAFGGIAGVNIRKTHKRK